MYTPHNVAVHQPGKQIKQSLKKFFNESWAKVKNGIAFPV